MKGYAGKILRVNLTRKKISTIKTKKYEKWAGGHGMGSAIFWDLVKDKTIDGFDPRNVVTLMTSPLTGTLTPAASGRTEMQGIGVQSYPIGWFTRSNFGGRFSTNLRFAGWDGIVIEGKADRPVWIDIRDRVVKIRDCSSLSLWGKDTRECQEIIWDFVVGKTAGGRITGAGSFTKWIKLKAKGGRTTQRPAVLTIGPAGENLGRTACLIHDASNSSGQGGFGGVWGSKNLKAVSVIGTGSITIADPKGLVKARLWQMKNYGFDLDNLERKGFGQEFHSPPVPMLLWAKGRPDVDQRPQACAGCHAGCRARFKDKLGNEASCIATVFYFDAQTNEIQRKASDLVNRYGVNAVDALWGLLYIKLLNQFGLLTSEKIPECPLDFYDYGSFEFVEQFIKMIAYRNDGKGNKSQFGEDIAEGFVRAAKKWGRMEEDLKSGILLFPHWGIGFHKEPRAQVYWGYGSILGDRDINEHSIDTLQFYVSASKVKAEEAVKIFTDKMVPFQGDMRMLDFSTKNIYSAHMAKLVAWHRHYTRFWKQSMLFCDLRWPDFINLYASDKIGSTGMAEPKFLRAVTGKKISFLDGINLGKKIWNLDNAIWTLQGRHRDMVHFADFIYTQNGGTITKPRLPGMEDGEWGYYDYCNRSLDKKKFDEFKTRFYELEGWDTKTGWPKGSTLSSLGLGYVANELKRKGKLGSG
jgi:aldehyde:ferredoxin oxidoreductase